MLRTTELSTRVCQTQTVNTMQMSQPSSQDHSQLVTYKLPVGAPWWGGVGAGPDLGCKRSTPRVRSNGAVHTCSRAQARIKAVQLNRPAVDVPVLRLSCSHRICQYQGQEEGRGGWGKGTKGLRAHFATSYESLVLSNQQVLKNGIA